MVLSLPVLVQALRTGRLYRRGPHGRVDRHRQPVSFWSSIAATGLLGLFGLTMLACGLLKTVV
jgi:hypothetical protein